MVGNANVYDGRHSSYPHPTGRTVENFMQHNAVGAVAYRDVSGGLTFLSEYFFSPPNANAVQQRALILLHESVHAIGKKSDDEFGGSRMLTKRIAGKCFPILAKSGLGYMVD
jgi:hypothetical protein